MLNQQFREGHPVPGVISHSVTGDIENFQLIFHNLLGAMFNWYWDGSTQVQSMIPWAQYEVKSRVAWKSLTWNFQGERLKNHLGSRLNFKTPLKVADRFVITFSNSMLAVSGCSLGSVWACIGFHVSFWVILLKKLVAWFPGEQNPLETVGSC